MKRISIIISALALSATGALAKDKMDKVDIVADGIDLSPVVVEPVRGGYGAPSAQNHTFKVRGFAGAKKTYVVNAAWFFSGKTSAQTYQQNVHQSAGKQQFKLSTGFKVPMDKIVWYDVSPQKMCQGNYTKLRNAGLNDQQIFSKDYEFQVRAVIGFGAAADKKGRPASNVGMGGGSTYEHKTINYPVQVLCKAR